MTVTTVPRFAGAAIATVAAIALATGTAGAAAAAATTAGAAANAPTAAAALVVITEHGQVSHVVSEVIEQGGTVERSLPNLDTVVVNGISAATVRADDAVLSVSPDVRMSGRSAGWGDDVPALDTSTASSSAPLSALTSTTPPLETAVSAPLTQETNAGPDASPTAGVIDTVALSQAEDAIGARMVWPYGTGRGIDVALIDTGIAPVAGLTGAGKVVNGPDLSFESQDPGRRYVDHNGHGTHMAGIIAASDVWGISRAVDAGPSAVEGVAPGARLVNVKVGDGNGVTDVSQVLAAIDWVVQHAHDPNGAAGGLNIRVLNLSYGTDSAQSAAIDPLAHAAEVAWRNGIVVVAAAGNDGAATGRLADPAIDPYLIAVGAADTGVGSGPSDFTVPSFSGRGDGVRNPDVIAPGVHIASLNAPGSAVDTAYGAAAGVGTRLIRGSGTSQSTAMVSGAAALLLSIHPSLSPDRVKALLTRSAHAVSGAGPRDEGAGLINVYRTLGARSSYATQTFTASTGGGTLDGARGTHIVTLDGVPLVGEQDIFGAAFDATAVATNEEGGIAWTGGVWNGSSWAGSSWAGSSWAGSSWAGSSWAGSSWAGSSWAGSSWAGSSWAGSVWGDRTPAPAATPTPDPTVTPDPTPSAAPSPDPAVSADPVPAAPDPSPPADTGTTDPSAAGGTS